MRLESFRIINCFGFGDSGVIRTGNGDDPIYVLGRNSSGKSSLLIAIKHFAAGAIPRDHPNFKNFDPTGDEPTLTAEFTMEQDDLAFAQLLDRVQARIQQAEGNEPRPSLDLVQNALELGPLYEELANSYQTLIEQVTANNRVWVQKTAAGNYRFLTSPSDNSYHERQQRIGTILLETFGAPNQSTVLGSMGINITIPPTEFEDYLFSSFPKIVAFDESFPLGIDLPNNITRDTLGQEGQNKLLDAFILLLGKDVITSYLDSNNPNTLDRLGEEMQLIADKVVEKANFASQEAGNKSLLGIRLYAKDGLNISFSTDGKPSYYSQLSENTKFLFAYYLYQETQNIRNSILLFDEPDRGFHPTAQADILRFLKSLAEKQNLLVIATHSQHMIDPTLLSGVRIMSVDSDGRLLVRNDFHNPVGNNESLAIQPILDSIGFTYSRQIGLKDRIVITEGLTDMIYLLAFNEMLIFTDKLDIAPATGSAQILNIIPFLISQDLSFKVVIDKDRYDVRKAIRDSFHVPNDAIYTIPVPSPFQPKFGESGIEDLFSKRDYEELLGKVGHTVGLDYTEMPNNIYMKKHKGDKWLVADWLYRNRSKCSPASFEPDTLDNFRQVLQFCTSDKWFRV